MVFVSGLLVGMVIGACVGLFVVAMLSMAAGEDEGLR